MVVGDRCQMNTVTRDEKLSELTTDTVEKRRRMHKNIIKKIPTLSLDHVISSFT